ncbi:MAG: hypothetical protein AB7Q29_06940 [Vicinamibacterales bacterium]
MQLQTRDVLLAGDDGQAHTVHMDVRAAAGGGWDVSATLDGHLVARRHCGDWHKTERACAWVESEIHALMHQAGDEAFTG